MILNKERLNLEYIQWCVASGDGRNEQDLRFGQYLWTKYDNMKDFTDVFNYESAKKAYTTLLIETNGIEQKN